MTDTDFDIFAEASAESDWDNYDEYNYEYEYDEEPPIWIPPGPPRWFRSNAGGMTLEETPSRLIALRNRFSLVIDYLGPDELHPLLAPFFQNDFTIEIRVLYEEGEESRRQWMFRDEEGTTRLNAVFRYIEPDEHEPDEPDEHELDELDELDDPDAADVSSNEPILVGFIEIFNEHAQIASDYLFLEDGTEMLTTFFYNENMLIRSETQEKSQGGETGVYRVMHTDHYRYNRAFALRHVERVFHESAEIDPVRQLFPYRALDAAAADNFLSEVPTILPDFFGDLSVGVDFRLIHETDSRGRVLSQTLLDDEGEVVWVITNTWLDDRILSIRRTEGDDEMLTEYEYNSDGNRIVQRDINNGVLERQIRIDGTYEVEELFMNGVLVLRAFWEDGRKISEERVRHQ